MFIYIYTSAYMQNPPKPLLSEWPTLWSHTLDPGVLMCFRIGANQKCGQKSLGKHWNKDFLVSSYHVYQGVSKQWWCPQLVLAKASGASIYPKQPLMNKAWVEPTWRTLNDHKMQHHTQWLIPNDPIALWTTTVYYPCNNLLVEPILLLDIVYDYYYYS